MRPVAFVIVADVRTGSTLLSSTLNLHPDIRCLGELFHPLDFSDNQVPGVNRFEISGAELTRHAFKAAGAKAAGFRAMVFLPSGNFPCWADAWQALGEYPGLRAVILQRQDRLAQYVSYRIAVQTGKWHPSAGDPVLDQENRPRITIDPREFRAWKNERDRLFSKRRGQLQGKAVLDVDYLQLTGNWDATIGKIQGFLDVEPIRIRPAKQKQEKRKLSRVVENFAELEKAGMLGTGS